MNLCFDLDGPILDVMDRYYRAYLESLSGTNITKEQVLSKERYWQLKQNRITDLEVGIMSGLGIADAKNSAEARKDLTFKHEYLALDKIFDDVYKVFEYLKSKKITFFIVTLRRKKQLMFAVKQHKLNNYLSEDRMFSLPDEQAIKSDIQEKYILLVNAINKLSLNPLETWLIGDSETDVHSSRLARYGKVVAICRGIKSKEQLKILNPDFLISSLNELPAIIEEASVAR